MKINLSGPFVRPKGDLHHFVWPLIISHRFSHRSHFSWPELQESIDSTWHLQTTSTQCYKVRFWKTMNGGEGIVSEYLRPNLGMGGHVVWANLKPCRRRSHLGGRCVGGGCAEVSDDSLCTAFKEKCAVEEWQQPFFMLRSCFYCWLLVVAGVVVATVFGVFFLSFPVVLARQLCWTRCLVETPAASTSVVTSWLTANRSARELALCLHTFSKKICSSQRWLYASTCSFRWERINGMEFWWSWNEMWFT